MKKSPKKKYKKKGKVETGLLEQAAREVIRAKKANGNRVPHRLLEEKVDELNGLEDVNLTFDKRSLQNWIRAIEKQEKREQQPVAPTEASKEVHSFEERRAEALPA